MVCAFASIILGVSFCSLSGRGHTQYRAGIMAKVSALFHSVCSTSVLTLNNIEMDAKILGERLRLIRKRLGITQKQLAEATRLTQSVMSRMENGEEVYASALLTILTFYQGKINLNYLFSPDFNEKSKKLLNPNSEDQLLSFRRQLDIIADVISSANETCLSQIVNLKKKCQ